MLAFVSDSMMPLGSSVEGGYKEVLYAVIGWHFLKLSYHAILFAFCMGGLVERGPAWCVKTKQDCSSMERGCRISRYYKCRKRARRQGRGDSRCCLLESALSKLQMPAPLPFRRRRRTEPQESNESKLATDTNQDISEADTLSASTTSELHQRNDLPSIKQSAATQPQAAVADVKDKTTKKRRKKSRVSSSMVPRTSLMDLARMQHWSLLLERASSREKKEARYQDADGLLPLHWAVSGGPPVEVVEALLKAYPKSASAVDGEGSTALHFACHYSANVSVMELLLATNEGAIRMQDKHGRSPLYHAVDKRASIDVIRLLAQADPSMITTACLPPDEELAAKVRSRDARPLAHRTPLFVAWAKVVLASQHRRNNSKDRLWEKAELLLQIAHAYHSSQYITYRMVHAAVSLDTYLPTQVIYLALEIAAEQLSKPNEDGRMPLAIAAATDQLTMSRSQDLIAHLLQLYPQAAIAADAQGSTPLALAVASGKTWNAGVKDLFAAAPNVGNWRDGSTKLYPALQAAAAKMNEGEESDLERSNSPHRIYSTFPLRQDTNKLKDWETNVKGVEKSTKELGAWKNIDVDARHLSTVFELVRADPSIMK